MRARFVALMAVLVCSACAVDDDLHHHDDEDVGAAFEAAWEEQLDEGKADGPGCSGVRVPDRGPFGMRVALTFDDGPNPATTPDVMAILREREIPATFFINGNRVTNDETRAIVADMVADPLFELANHSWSHPNMAQLGATDVVQQIEGTTEKIEQAGGTPRYFRFPFGSSTCGTAAAVRDRDYAITGWHVDSADWCFARRGGVCPESTFRHVPDGFREDMVGFVMDQAARYEGGILLFHDIHRYTADAVVEIIDRLAAAGFTFTNLDDMAAFPRLNGETPPFVGDACDDDDQCMFTPGSFCHDAGFCTVPCAGTCDDGPKATFCIQNGEADEGICVVKTDDAAACEGVPNTSAKMTDRYIGGSGASARTAQVCAP